MDTNVSVWNNALFAYKALVLESSGKLAAHNPAASNPYDKGTPEYEAWQKGYDEEKAMLDGVNQMAENFIQKARDERDAFNIEMRLLHISYCYGGPASRHAIKKQS